MAVLGVPQMVTCSVPRVVSLSGATASLSAPPPPLIHQSTPNESADEIMAWAAPRMRQVHSLRWRRSMGATQDEHSTHAHPVRTCAHTHNVLAHAHVCMSTHVHVAIYMRPCACLSMHVCTCACMSTHVHACLCVYTHAHIYVSTCLHIYLTCPCMYAHLHVNMHMYVHTCACLHVYTCMCIDIDMYTCTHTHELN